MPTFARQVDAIPVVRTTAERAQLFPSPEQNQRVQNLETGYIERWTSGAWTPDYEFAAGGAINVKTFGAIGDGVTDDTVAIQAAIDAAGAYGQVIFPDGIYRAVGLTNTHIGQRWLGYGLTLLRKNGNGVILTGSAREQEYHNIGFDGESGSYTGNNVNLTGDSPVLINCFSNDAAGRALLATGQHVQILGGSGPWATTDASATGYDIEIGVSGTNTAYHVVHGIRSSQSTGGIKFIDAGSQAVTDCQFGKYWVASGTSPAGVNGGKAMGCRILGPVQIDISNSVLIGNQFGGSATIDYASGTSGHEYWGNVDTNAAITNAGNGSSAIVRQVGNDGTIQLQYGDDSSAAIMKAKPDGGGLFTFPQVEIPNNVAYRLMRASPNQTSRGGGLGITASDNVQLTADVAAIQYAVATGQTHQFLVNSSEVARINGSGVAVSVAAASQSSGVVALGNGTQTTVGAAGAASALPATPSGYLRFYLGSTHFVIPYYAQA